LLFQVEHDLSESIDRAKERPKIAKMLSDKLAAYQKNIEVEGSFWH